MVNEFLTSIHQKYFNTQTLRESIFVLAIITAASWTGHLSNGEVVGTFQMAIVVSLEINRCGCSNEISNSAKRRKRISGERRKKKERGEKGADCFESEKFLIDIVFCTFNFVDECAGLF